MLLAKRKNTANSEYGLHSVTTVKPITHKSNFQNIIKMVKVDSKFVGTFYFNLCPVKVRPKYYGKAAMIISTLLGIDHRVAEQMAADSGKPSLDIAVNNLIKLQLVKICLNEAGVFIAGNKLDTTYYLKKNADHSVPDLVGNDNVAKEAYYEAYKLFRSSYADMFHITVPKVDDVEDEDRIDVAPFVENREQETKGKPEDIVMNAILDDIKSHLQVPLSPAEIDRARKYFIVFRARLIMAELMKLDPSDPLFNLLDQKLHGSKDQREKSNRRG